MANLQLIKSLAEKRGMTITELAERVGVSEQQIHLMVRKNSTKIETLEKIAKVLGVSTSYFFDDIITIKEQYEQHGDHNLQAHHIDEVKMVDKRGEALCTREDKICSSAVLDERVKALEALIAEKDERIKELKERIEELKAK